MIKKIRFAKSGINGNIVLKAITGTEVYYCRTVAIMLVCSASDFLRTSLVVSGKSTSIPKSEVASSYIFARRLLSYLVLVRNNCFYYLHWCYNLSHCFPNVANLFTLKWPEIVFVCNSDSDFIHSTIYCLTIHYQLHK